MAQQYGTAAGLTVLLAGPFGSGGAAVKLTEITLTAAGWKGAASPYAQQVAVDGISVNSLVDLQPDAQQLAQLRRMELALTAVNEEGVVTVYATGDLPAEDITVQATVTEVTA